MQKSRKEKTTPKNIPKPSSEELKKRIAELKKKRDSYLAGWQRCRADFLNYKKDEGKRLQLLVDYEKEEWALEMIAILEQFEKARQELKDKTPAIEGFLQIEKYFKDFLRGQGIEEIKSEKGKVFNPEIEEAVETEKTEDSPEGTILEIIQKGYKYKDKIIRPSRVKVAG